MCLSPLNLVRWQTELGTSSVADIADRQAGRHAANPTCQPTRSESMPVWDHADTPRKQSTVQLWTEQSASVRNMLIQASICWLSNFRTEQNQPKKIADVLLWSITIYTYSIFGLSTDQSITFFIPFKMNNRHMTNIPADALLIIILKCWKAISH